MERECTMEVKRKSIDWETTGKNLRNLRCNDLNLRRFVCKALKHDGCDGADCDNCKEYYMDNHITQGELAQVMNVTSNMIVNWERGTSRPTLEDLLLYCDICKKELFDIIVFY